MSNIKTPKKGGIEIGNVSKYGLKFTVSIVGRTER